MSEKIKILLIKKGITAAELAERMETKPQNLYNKFKRDNFSEKELLKIAELTGVKYEGFFFLEDGTKV